MMTHLEKLFQTADSQESEPDAEGTYYVRGNPNAAEEYISNDCTRCPGCGEGLLKEEPIREEASGDSSMSRYGFCPKCNTIVVETLRVTHAEVLYGDELSRYLS